MNSFSAYRFFLFVIVLFCTNWNSAVAQNFHMVKDINNSTDANPGNCTIMNGICYFSANEDTLMGLWRSDGTIEGTYKIINADIEELISANGKIFFTTFKESPGLWVSDGTVAGTHKVITTIPDSVSSFSPQSLTNVNGTVYFTIDGHSSNDQLWKTNGTAEGTVLVKDFYGEFPDAHSIGALTAIGDKLYFVMAMPYSPYDYYNYLWSSDGTTEGTEWIDSQTADVSNITAGPTVGSHTMVYYLGKSDPHVPQRRLYVTNGEPGNMELAPGVNFYFDGSETMLSVGTILYFTANGRYSTVKDLYRYDMIAANDVVPVMLLSNEINEKGYHSSIYALSNDANGQLYFSLYDAPSDKFQLWKSDGTSQGNTLLNGNLNAYLITSVDNGIYFSGIDSLHGRELWKSDGTPPATVMVKDINPGTNSSNPSFITYSLNNVAFIGANDGQHGIELWKTDGTDTGTALVKDINISVTSSSNPSSIIASNDIVYFTANDGHGGPQRLWKSDGTDVGTSMVSYSLEPPTNIPYTLYSTLNDILYTVGTINNEYGLIKTDGTEAGTVLVKNLPEGGFLQITSTNNLIYFVIHNIHSDSSELWRSNGTDTGTYVIRNDFTSSYRTMDFASTGSILFFSPKTENQLWKTDGSISGTVLVKTFATLKFDFNGSHLFAYNNKVYLEASEQNTPSGLWSSDGTGTGTVLISSDVYDINNYAISGNKLYFTATGNPATYGDIGIELFKTDGTTAGTQLVKDIVPGNISSAASNLTDANGTLYFFARGSSNTNISLWKSNGTSPGTQLIQFLPTNIYNHRGKLLSANGILYIVNSDSTLWQSDGTPNGTHAVEDTNLLNVQVSYSSDLVIAGNNVYFNGTTNTYGTELYAGKAGSALAVALLSVSGKLVNGNGVLRWSTANEYNSSHFVLERSLNGRDYYSITTVRAAGNANIISTYNYTDSNIYKLGASYIYYRIKEVDRDGKTLVSPVVILKIDNMLTIAAIPNPVVERLVITVTAPVSIRAQITIANADGRLMVNDGNKTVNAGTTDISYNAASWASGVYFVKVILSNGSSQVTKVLKQ